VLRGDLPARGRRRSHALPGLRADHLKAPLLGLALALLLPLAAAAADVILLRNGDRVSGRIVSETPRAIRVQTPYGRFNIPRDRIERVQREGKPEQVLNPPLADVGPSLPRRDPTRARLVLVVVGRTFWQAWRPREAPADPTLRFEVRVDEEPVAAFVDAKLDPEEIPGATVNAFSFAAGDVAIHAAPEVVAAPPEVNPGRIVVRLDLPAARAGKRRLRFAYQVNDGPAAEPSWRDLAEGTVTVDIGLEAPNFVQVRQDAGQMEYAGLFFRRRMRNVETFRLDPVLE
jgi:hypothetical protein